jgi:hypothetical protein
VKARFAGSLAWIAVALLAAAAAGVLVARWPGAHRLALADARLAAWAPGLAAGRWLGVLLLVAGWHRAVAFAAKRRGWGPARQRLAAGLRWRLCGWFLAIELLLVQGGLARVLRWLWS